MEDIIHTERLRLRFPTIEDSEFIQREFPKWEIVKYMSTHVPWPYPEDGAKSYLEESLLPKFKSGEMYAFIIELKQGEELSPIGFISYEKADPEEYDGDGYVRAFWLALDYHGKGYMTEASMAANTWMFRNTDTPALFTDNAVENEVSDNIKVKQGWKFTGVEDADGIYRGGFPYEHCWRLTRERWEELNNIK